ncbi:MAG TPA: hypothetical protein VLR47_13365, partial [Rhodospirillales bacterium]|nr:hypothetical protein [Rhodospirillales bacterium]
MDGRDKRGHDEDVMIQRLSSRHPGLVPRLSGWFLWTRCTIPLVFERCDDIGHEKEATPCRIRISLFTSALPSSFEGLRIDQDTYDEARKAAPGWDVHVL